MIPDLGFYLLGLAVGIGLYGAIDRYLCSRRGSA